MTRTLQYKYYTPQSAAMHKNVSRQSVWDLINRGKLQHARSLDNRIYIPEWALWPDRHPDLDQQQAAQEIQTINHCRARGKLKPGKQPIILRTSQSENKLYHQDDLAPDAPKPKAERRKGEWQDGYSETLAVIEGVNLSDRAWHDLDQLRQQQWAKYADLTTVPFASEIVLQGLNVASTLTDADMAAWKQTYSNVDKPKRLRISLPASKIVALDAVRQRYDLTKNRGVDLLIWCAIHLTTQNNRV